MNNLKKQIVEKSKELEIDLIGFCDSDFSDLYNILKKQEKLKCKSNLQKTSINNYMPSDLLSSVNTIISIGISYPSHKEMYEKLKDNEVGFSSSSIGMDYHIILKEKLTNLCKYIETLVSDFEYKICVDTTIIDDRFAAYKSGIGFYGKNGLIINPLYGSYIYLGTVLTNLDIEKDKKLNITCKGCNKCINICPGKAINNDGILDYTKCLSYITQKKEELSDDEKKIMGQSIFGCDLCQVVCPHNNKEYHLHKCFEPIGIEVINIDKYIPLSNEEFKKIYGNLSGSFRGKKIIERNIKIYKDKKS